MRAHRSITTTAAVVTLAFLALLSTGEHTVRAGETLAEIAAQHDTTVRALAEANGLADADLIRVGQTLTIPSGGSGAGSGSAYTVRAGDTLGLIAARHGTSIRGLLELNSVDNPNLILVGQVLQLPSGSGGGAAAATATPASGARTHVVRPGESIAGIAGRYGISQAQLVAANGLTDGRVYVGQQLRLVPTGGTPAAASGSPGRYEVKTGDTLLSIAIDHGTRLTALQEANGIDDPDALVVGQTLEIPGGGGGAGGSIVCPVQGGASLMNDWGFPRSGGRFHEGNDLFASRGTPAVATVSGEVVQTTGKIGGNQVKLFGDDGVSYYYTHLDGFGEAGRVQAGTVIGYVGTSGNAAGGTPHVHFEIHPGGGAAINPYPLVSAVC
jgi:murein DD-endopeptidase MepM/ murein hydrolase activator NlpD